MGSVWYVGEASARRISSADWARAGIPDRPSSVWDGGNGYSRPQAEFTPGQLVILDADDGFALTDVDGPRPGATQGPELSFATRGWVLERMYEDRQSLLALISAGDSGGGGVPDGAIDGGTP